MRGAWAARSSRPPTEVRPSRSGALRPRGLSTAQAPRSLAAVHTKRGATTQLVANEADGPPLAAVAAQHQHEGIARDVGDGEEEGAVLLEAERHRTEGAAHARGRIELERAHRARG